MKGWILGLIVGFLFGGFAVSLRDLWAELRKERGKS